MTSDSERGIFEKDLNACSKHLVAPNAVQLSVTQVCHRVHG